MIFSFKEGTRFSLRLLKAASFEAATQSEPMQSNSEKDSGYHLSGISCHGLARWNSYKELVEPIADFSDGLRWYLARQDETPACYLLILAKDKSSDVRFGLLTNPNTPKEALMILANDRNAGNRAHVQHHGNTTPEITAIANRPRAKRKPAKSKPAKRKP